MALIGAQFMSTILNLGHNHNYNFNESRLNRVMNAETLAEAQYMGLWDRIKDFFQGGVKRQAIEALFDQINQPARHDASPNKQLEKFERLIDLAKPEQQTKFTVEVNPPNEARLWSFQFKIVQHSIYQSNTIADQADTSYDSFCSAKTEIEHRQFIRQNAGLLERVNHFFQDEMKSQALEKLFQIYHPSSDDIALNERLQKFEQLIQLAKPEHQKDFTIDADPPNKYGEWNYRLQIAEHTIYQTNNVVDSANTSYGVFCAAATGMAFRQYIADNPDIFGIGHDSTDDHIRVSIQCMSDDEIIREQLGKNLDNPKYGHENFCTIEEVADSAKFIAHFKEGSLEFSNRDNLHGEFRGAVLKNALQSGNYRNLRELCVQGNNRRGQNTMLLYAVPPHLDIFIQQLTKGNSIEWPDGMYDPIKFLIENKSPLISKETVQALHKQVIGDTTLGKLFGITQPGIDDTDGKRRNTIVDKRV